MTMLKTIDGHSSVRALKRYLERNGRAAATLCLNLGDEREWAADMDATRRAHGHDRKRGGRGRTRFYEHFVASPNPKDEAALDKDRVMGLAARWAREMFPDHEIAVVLHDDAARAGYHAHVVVNCTNLATGLKLQMGDKDQRRQANRLQRISEELGFSALPDLPARRADRDARTSAERGMASRGEASWKEDIRRAVTAAGAVSEDFASLERALGSAGYSMRLTRRGITYFHPDGEHKATDESLGRAFSPSGIEALAPDARWEDFPSEVEGKGALSHFSADDLARCLLTIRREGVGSLRGFDALKESVEGRLAAARAEMREIAARLASGGPEELQADLLGREEALVSELDEQTARLSNLSFSRHVAATVLREAEEARSAALRGTGREGFRGVGSRARASNGEREGRAERDCSEGERESAR